MANDGFCYPHMPMGKMWIYRLLSDFARQFIGKAQNGKCL